MLHRQKALLRARNRAFCLCRTLLQVAAFAQSLMFVGFFDRAQAALHLAALLQEIREAKVGAGSDLVRLAGIQQIERLGEVLIGGGEIAGLVANLCQRDQSLPLCLGVVAGAREVQRLPRLLLRFLALPALEQQFGQAGMADGGSDFIVEFALNGNGLPVLPFGAVEVILLLQRAAQALVGKANEPLLVSHLVDRQAAHRVLASHRQLANRLVMLADFHILMGKAPGVAVHRIQRIKGLVIEIDGLLQIAEPEVVVRQVAVDIKREDGIGNLPALDGGMAAEMVLHCERVVVEQVVGFAEQIARPLDIFAVVKSLALLNGGAQINYSFLVFTGAQVNLPAQQVKPVYLIGCNALGLHRLKQLLGLLKGVLLDQHAGLQKINVDSLIGTRVSRRVANGARFRCSCRRAFQQEGKWYVKAARKDRERLQRRPNLPPLYGRDVRDGEFRRGKLSLSHS